MAQIFEASSSTWFLATHARSSLSPALTSLSSPSYVILQSQSLTTTMSNEEIDLPALLSSPSSTPVTIATTLTPLTSTTSNTILNSLPSPPFTLLLQSLRLLPKSDYETLGQTVRSKWNGALQENSVEEWEKLNAFVACLDRDVDVGGYDVYAIWAFRSSLESAEGKDANGWIPAAKGWITHTGVRIYALSLAHVDMGTPARGGPRWSNSTKENAGFQGFSVERWELWKEVFEEVGEGEIVKRMCEIEEEAKK